MELSTPPRASPVYSVIVPAFNEERWLATTLDAVRTAMDAVDISGEVLVVDNNSTDRTANIAVDAGLRVVFEPINQISRARNTGAKAAHGRYLIFLDADTTLSQRLLETALENMSGAACCGGGAMVAFDGQIPWFAGIGLATWNWTSRRFSLAAGCFVYCLREGFEAAGGFSEKVYAGDEVWFSRHLRSWGQSRDMTFRIIEDPPAVTSNRKFQWYSPLDIILRILLMVILPFAVCLRPLCSFWYRRPSQ